MRDRITVTVPAANLVLSLVVLIVRPDREAVQ